MGNRIEPGFGMLLFDAQFSPDSEAPIVDPPGTFDSSYTQAGAGPGQPLPPPGSLWRPEVQGSQTTEVTTTTIRGGLPRRSSGGAAVLVREAGETAETDWRSWNEPNYLQTWTTPTTGYGASADWDRIDAVTLPGNNAIAVLASSLSGLVVAGQLWRYNPRGETWADGYDFDAASADLQEPVALAVDPDTRRLIAWFGEGPAGSADLVSLYSEDRGDSWNLHGRSHFAIETFTGRVKVAPTSRNAWLMIRAGANDLYQFSSIDGGVTWDQVGAVASGAIVGYQADCVPLPSGGFLVVYHDPDSSGFPKARRLATAGSAFADATEITISGSVPVETIVCAVDDDGIVYVAATADTDTVSAVTWRNDQVVVWRSVDEGVSWEEYSWGALQDTAGTAYVELEAAVCSNGQLHLLHTIAATSASLGDSFGLFSFGGWDSVEQGVGNTLLQHLRTERIGFGFYHNPGGPTIAGSAVAWYPADFPDQMGWALNGLGTATLISGGYLRLSTGALQTLFYARSYAHIGNTYTAGQCWVQVTSGGSSSSDAIAIQGRMSPSAATDHRFSIRLTTTSITVYDVHGAANLGSTGGLDLTTGIYIRWIQTFVAIPRVTVWYRLPGDTKWTLVVEEQATTNIGAGGAGTDAVAWGHITASAAQSEWRLLGSCPDGDYRYRLDPITNPSPPPLAGLLFGRQLPPRRSAAYPYPGLTQPSEPMGRLGASGRAVQGENVTHPVGYTRPIERLYPDLSPKPTRYWESADDSEQLIAWDLGRSCWIGGGIALVALNAWPREWVLEHDDGGAGWTTAVTLDLALGVGLLGSVSGSSLQPRAGTTGVGRYVHEGELVGGYALVSAAGPTTVARRICANSGGYWEDSTTVQAVQICLEGTDGTEDTSGTCTIVAPSGFVVYYPAAHLIRRRWRIRIAASQLTPSGTYRAGLAAIARVVGTVDPDWRWRRALELQREINTDRSGFPRIKELGDPYETLEYSWTDGLMLKFLRDVDNDYIGPSGGQPIGTKEDPATAMWGWMQHALRSWEMPACMVSRLPTTTGQTVTDPTLWRYGVMMTEILGMSGVSGTEGDTNGCAEVVRLDSVLFRGQKGIIRG